MKRLIDVLLSVAGLVVLSPLLLFTALAIVLDDGFPVLFGQARVGLRGQVFNMFKFRSMRHDATDPGPYFTRTQDCRVTRVGRIIRRLSVDELPQLFNVARGDMSLVGPRPDLPLQRALYSDADWVQRCSVRPGVTGLSQATYRSSATPSERLALDLRYTREVSVSLDIKILWSTIGRLFGKDAN
jgi:lipopolysaccharide/colanic/teichoic acid biosynthesis glycosyltransferase